DGASLDRGLRAGRCGAREVTLFDTAAFRTRIAMQAPDPSPPVPEEKLAFASRPDRFGLQASCEAVRDAGLAPADLARAACIFGTGTGGAHLTDGYTRSVLYDGEAAADPNLLRPHQPASVTDLVCR